jgi:outer membrane protein OmpA-like peptidoglycan-associated protein
MALTLVAGLLLASGTAHAQGGPVDLNMFKPAMDSKGHFSIDSTQVLSPWTTSFGLMVNYARNPLNMEGGSGRFYKTTDLVGANLQFAMGLFKLEKKGKPWLEVGFGVPIAFHNSQIGVSDFGRAAGTSSCPGTYPCTMWQQAQGNKYPMNYDEDGRFTAQGLGDMYLHLKFRFKDTSTFPVGLGAMLSIYFPSSRVGNGQEKMIGSGGVTLAPKFLLDKYWRKQKILLSVNFGLRLRFATTGKLTGNQGWSSCLWTENTTSGISPSQQSCGNDVSGAHASDYGFDPTKGDNGLSRELTWLYEITYGVGMSWELVKSVVFVAEIFGSVELGSLLADDRVYQKGTFDPTETRVAYLDSNLTVKAFKRSFPLELMAGFKFYLAASSFFAVGAGLGLTGIGPLDNVGSPDVRIFASFVFEPTVGDLDGDGIKDDVDKCPDEPEDFDGFEDTDGCPDPDNDQDGILDVDDLCPNTPENYNGIEDNDGCPEKTEEDRDGDGIPDSVDKCPDVPEDKDGYEDKDGCPDPDNDGDGVPDKDDRCPGMDTDKASSFIKTKEDKDGFEDEDGCPDPDNDKDGILDKDDKCPNEPETYNNYKDDDGCPDEVPFKIGRTGFQLNEKIYFRTNKDIIRKVSFKLLDTLASVIKDRKDLRLIEIQGHTDQRGTRRYNISLSQKRAESVKRYLVNKGVEADRLRATGYGKGRLKCTAMNVLCWSTNRRVEFVIIKRGAAPAPRRRR